MIDGLLHGDARVDRQSERIALGMLGVLLRVGLKQASGIGQIILAREAVVNLHQRDFERTRVVHFGLGSADGLQPPETLLSQLLVQVLYVAH